MARTSLFRTYAEAGTMGAVAAIGVVAVVVAISGIRLNVPAAALAEVEVAESGLAPPVMRLAATPAPVPQVDSALVADAAAAPVEAAISVIDHLREAAETAARWDEAPDQPTAGALGDQSAPGPLGPQLTATPGAAATSAATTDVEAGAAAPDGAAIDAASIEVEPKGPAADTVPAGQMPHAPVPAQRPRAVAALQPPAAGRDDAAGNTVPPATETAAADPAPSATATAPANLRIVTGSGANVRSGPSTANGALFAVAGGSRVTVTGESKRGWLHITDEQGRDGWIYGDYLEKP